MCAVGSAADTVGPDVLEHCLWQTARAWLGPECSDQDCAQLLHRSLELLLISDARSRLENDSKSFREQLPELTLSTASSSCIMNRRQMVLTAAWKLPGMSTESAVQLISTLDHDKKPSSTYEWLQQLPPLLRPAVITQLETTYKSRTCTAPHSPLLHPLSMPSKRPTSAHPSKNSKSTSDNQFLDMFKACSSSGKTHVRLKERASPVRPQSAHPAARGSAANVTSALDTSARRLSLFSEQEMPDRDAQRPTAGPGPVSMAQLAAQFQQNRGKALRIDSL
eukprot:TRINITY_DN56781_c0_g1_i1.p1 TRINITY_DN56781_c0_g1~~TRINITY_DN56781_c0_g1_i1.p1  ORF type:complete len:279 (-),score=36.56 TRINITY_DN56781_c0_g1_i1:197-1033(-)